MLSLSRDAIILSMTPKAKERLEQAKKQLRLISKRIEANYKPEKIILFGSIAKENITDSSDIDLLIIKNTQKDPWARLKEVDRLVDHNFPTDFLVYTPKEIKKELEEGNSFIEDALNNGKVIYEK